MKLIAKMRFHWPYWIKTKKTFFCVMKKFSQCFTRRQRLEWLHLLTQCQYS